MNLLSDAASTMKRCVLKQIERSTSLPSLLEAVAQVAALGLVA